MWRGAEAFGFTSPLVTTASGAKMGKTAQGAVWLNADLRSPYDYWQFWRNTEDADVGRFLRLFTDLPLDEVARLEALRGAEINEAKKVLAGETTALLHGRAAADAAEAAARAAFEEGATSADLPSFEISRGALEAGVQLAALIADAGLATSRSEARRLAQGGGLRLNDRAEPDAPAHGHRLGPGRRWRDQARRRPEEDHPRTAGLSGRRPPLETTDMTEISVGDAAPDFDLPTDGGGRASLAALKGKPFVLYFYPKDDTSGCTSEAKAFSEMKAQFEEAGAAVIGVSKDSPISHDKFKAKYDLTISLASDEDGAMLERYGVWVEKSMYGRKYMGIDRTTFLVGADGLVQQVWRKVKVPGHVDAVLKAVRALAA